jgi:hypothetical protein
MSWTRRAAACVDVQRSRRASFEASAEHHGHIPPPDTSFASLTRCPPSPQVGGMKTTDAVGFWIVIASQRVARMRARWQAPQSNPCLVSQARKMDRFVASAPRDDVADNSHTAQHSRSSLFLVPPTCGVETSRARSFLSLPLCGEGGAKRRVGASAEHHRHIPPPDTSFAPLTRCHPPHRFAGGGIKTRDAVAACAMTSQAIHIPTSPRSRRVSRASFAIRKAI